MTMMQNLNVLDNKNILILVSGSIAVYKAIELVSMFKKLGAKVRVVMSEEAKRFVTPLSFEAIAHTQVLHEQTESWADEIDGIACNHIAYARWADVAIIAPASANTLSKLSVGIADSLILSTVLACKAPKILAPAMNTVMFESKQVQESLRRLVDFGFDIIEPRVGLLACNIYGKGAMQEVLEIVFRVCQRLITSVYWKDREVIITGGGSVECIDSVRYLSNHSSGLQASTLALALYMLGAKVSLVSSGFPFELPLGVHRVEVDDTSSYLMAIKERIPVDKKVILFMAAAISDYVPKIRFESKLKKDKIGDDWQIDCKKNIDILKELDDENLFKIGFKAESDSQEPQESAKKMLENIHKGGKSCDIVCLNIIGKHNPFGSQNNEMILFSKDSVHHTGLKSKFEISFEIADFVKRTLC
ncbi:hypothetical protein BKH44_01700 [Helicobacter sp. 13S00477-4]|nr:hypothetical protein BKH44_01700 [Helicobacter sp. 13S00477-4]